MTNKFGCRPVVIVGTLVSTAAFIAASQTTDIDVLIFTYGVMGGFGLGMIYLPCIVIVNYYFEKRRGLANGIAVSGSGVGTFAYSPMSEILLSEYQWHGALLIIAGVIFNGCICGALMRPLTAKPRPRPKPKTKSTTREKNILDRLKESTNGKNSPCISQAGPTTPTHTSLGGGEFSPLLTVPDKSIAIGHDKGRVVQRRQTSVSGSRDVGPGGSRTNMSHLSSMRSLHVSKRDLARPMYRKDIFYSGSVLNIPQFQSQVDMKSYITSITTIPGESEFCCAFLPRSARDVLGEMIDVSLFKDVSFMLICIGNILTFLGFFIPFMFLVDRATELGVGNKEAAFLVSIIGITNTVGRVVVGKLADLKKLDSLIMAYLSIFLCGLVTAFVPLCRNYTHLAIVAALFGLGV
ncbi:hypothetical protein EGW08_009439, partial [Elysia chlorotica]